MGPVRGGMASREKKEALGGSAEVSGVEDAHKLLQKGHSRGGVGSKKRVRFVIRAERREQSEHVGAQRVAVAAGQ